MKQKIKERRKKIPKQKKKAMQPFVFAVLATLENFERQKSSPNVLSQERDFNGFRFQNTWPQFKERITLSSG